MSNATSSKFVPFVGKAHAVNSQVHPQASLSGGHQGGVGYGGVSYSSRQGGRRQGDELRPALQASQRPLTRFIQTGHLFRKVDVEGGYSVAQGMCCNDGCNVCAEDANIPLHCGGTSDTIYVNGKTYVVQNDSEKQEQQQQQ